MATAEVPSYAPQYTNSKPAMDFSSVNPQADQQRVPDQTVRNSAYSNSAAPTGPDRVATNILQASEMAAGVITRSAENAIVTLNQFVDDRIARTAPSSSPPAIPERWKSRAGIARSVSSVVAVGLTKSAELVGKAFFAVFKLMLALYYQIASMRGHTHMPLTDELTGVLVVGVSVLMAYVRVYDAIEQAATAAFTTTIDASQKYVSHKYGMHVSELSRELVGIAQDSVLSFLMWWRIALRAIISNGALREGKNFLAPHVPAELLEDVHVPPPHNTDRAHRD